MNKLENLPPEIESMKSLTDLYLSANELLELPENIGIKVLLYFYQIFLWVKMSFNMNKTINVLPFALKYVIFYLNMTYFIHKVLLTTDN